MVHLMHHVDGEEQRPVQATAGDQTLLSCMKRVLLGRRQLQLVVMPEVHLTKRLPSGVVSCKQQHRFDIRRNEHGKCKLRADE